MLLVEFLTAWGSVTFPHVLSVFFSEPRGHVCVSASLYLLWPGTRPVSCMPEGDKARHELGRRGARRGSGRDTEQ